MIPALRSTTRRVALFSLCIALMLVLGLLDRAIPLSALLSGGVPGLKLGLANTVLLYAVYLLDWKASILLMLAKVMLSGFLFGSVSAILYSLSGGVLSLAVMLAARKKPGLSTMLVCIAAFFSDAFLLSRNPAPGGQMLLCVWLIGLAGLTALGFFLFIRLHPDWGIIGVSMAGAVAHNVGQVLMAARVLRTPQLLTVYLPVLIGLGAAVGLLTGMVAQRVLHALRKLPEGGFFPR